MQRCLMPTGCSSRNCCDAGRGDAAYLCELPRRGVKKRDQEMGAQTVVRFRLCTIHADQLLASDKSTRVYELPGWLDSEPCGPEIEEPDDDY